LKVDFCTAHCDHAPKQAIGNGQLAKED